MANTNSTEADKWKSKYYDLLDKYDQQETDWLKSEKLLSAALSKLSIIAEGANPQIDNHLQALRVVLKEKFSHYRVESVLSELFNLVADVNKKSKNTKPQLIELDDLLAILDGIVLPKAFQKKKNSLLKELRKNPSDIESFINEFQLLFEASKSSSDTEVSGGFISRIFSEENKPDSIESVKILSNAIAVLPWPAALDKSSKTLVKSLSQCKDSEEFDALLNRFVSLIDQWGKSSPSETAAVEMPANTVNTETLNADSIKQESLRQFILRLKNFHPGHEQLQEIELADSGMDNEPEQLAGAISKLLELSSGLPLDYKAQNSEPDNHPKMREIFIQLLERLVVPVALLGKVEILKTYLETGNDKDWRLSLKKIVHFINEVRFKEFQEEADYEDFLHQITGRLQEMVQFLEKENRRIEQSDKKGIEFNRAVTKEVGDLREGLETAATLIELRTVVNSSLDAISGFMQQHSELEKNRIDSAKDNLSNMQDRIKLLENETAELKISLAEKNREAMYDVLTGIPNRLFYEKRVKEDIARWKRFETPLTLAVWDVDKFKSVNDTYGHKAGDKVLKAIAQILNKRIRETDFLARYGGEEFVMLLPGTIEEETLRLANELRQAVASCAFHYNNESVDITISCGISGFRAEDDLGKVFERADKALYQAKESGRNRCIIAGCRSD